MIDLSFRVVDCSYVHLSVTRSKKRDPKVQCRGNREVSNHLQYKLHQVLSFVIQCLVSVLVKMLIPVLDGLVPSTLGLMFFFAAGQRQPKVRFTDRGQDNTMQREYESFLPSPSTEQGRQGKCDKSGELIPSSVFGILVVVYQIDHSFSQKIKDDKTKKNDMENGVTRHYLTGLFNDRNACIIGKTDNAKKKKKKKRMMRILDQFIFQKRSLTTRTRTRARSQQNGIALHIVVKP